MKIKDVMTGNIETLQLADTVRMGAQKMKDLNVGAMPVMENGEAVGIITDRDITIRGVAGGLDPEQTRVSNIMTTGVLSCRQDDDVHNAIG